MGSAIGTTGVILVLMLGIPTIAIGSLIGALLVMPWARVIAKLADISFKKAYLQCVLGYCFYMFSAMAIGLIGWSSPMALLVAIGQLGFIGMILATLFSLAASNALAAKIIWKTSWIDALKGTLIIPIVIPIVSAIMYSAVFGAAASAK